MKRIPLAPRTSIHKAWDFLAGFVTRKNRRVLCATSAANRDGHGIMSKAWKGAVVLLTVASAESLPAQTPDGFNGAANGSVYAMAVQSDGKIITVGDFTSLAGEPRNFIGRFDPDGKLDPTFNPQVGGNYLCCLAVQSDGKIVIGGRFSSVAGIATGSLVRLNADGSLDSSFADPGANRLGVQTVALQADGKIVVGGNFNELGGQPRWHLGRLNTNGTLDTTFTAQTDNEVWCVVVQPDGKIVVGGMFNYVGGQLSPKYGRLNSDGSWDSSFRPNSSENVWWVASLTLQADGKILAGGYFGSLGGASRANIGRLNVDGTADSGFVPSVGGWVYSMVPQVDGRILVGTSWGSVRRFFPNGALDSDFSAPTDSGIFSITLQQDGKILVSGEFSTLGGASRGGLGRLNNTGPANESLTWDGSTLTWLRSGTGPEFWRTSFDATTDGTNWVDLGAGTRIGTGWQVVATNIPLNSTFRARGAVAGGYLSGVNWLAERSLGPLLLTSQPVSRTNHAATPAFFSVAAVGSPPLSYYWYKNGQPLQDGGLVSGARTATLILSNVFAGDRGNYFVVVSNQSGSVTSRLAALEVVDPLFMVQPVSQFTTFSNVVTFTVLAAGTEPLSYEWWKDGMKIGDGNHISGSGSPTLIVNPVSGADRGRYWAVVTNAYGCATSSVATLGVIDPGIITNPPSQLVNAGQTTIFGASVIGSAPLSYQWRKNGDPLSGQTAGTLTLTNVQWADAGSYDLIVANPFGSATSSPASLGFSAALDTFNVQISNNTVYAMVVQPDGCVVVGGSFRGLNAQPLTNLARLFPDGSIDPSFNARIAGVATEVRTLALLADGRLLVGGRFTSIDGFARTNLARLNPDGSVDLSFDARMTTYSVNALVVQRDGSIVVGGAFSSVGGQPRANLCRLTADGVLDPAFTPAVSSTVNCLAIQDDGSILVGGGFTTLAGKTRHSLGRLAPDGMLDDSFNPGVSGGVFALAVEPDGGIIVAGGFTQLGGVAKANLGRLTPDGSLETNFTSTANAGVYSLALQADGKVLVGGVFTYLGGQDRKYLGRLEANGSLDTTFDSGANGSVHTVALQPDGGIIADFSASAGQPQSRLVRLRNTGPALDVLTVEAGTNIHWLRNGTAPEIGQASFEFSSNGVSWIALGKGSRISGGWELRGVPVPAGCTLVARGIVAGGYEAGSRWPLASSIGPVAITRQPVSLTTVAGSTAGFSVEALGTAPLFYQWCKDGLPLLESVEVRGVNSSTLLLSNLFGADSGSFTVSVSNSYNVVTSRVANLFVIDPVIVTQPTNRLATNGQSIAYQALGFGSGTLTYQWRRNGVAIEGATNTTFIVTNAQWTDGGNYDVVVAGPYGSVASDMGALSFPAGVDSFNPSTSGSYYALAIQPDGAILAGGTFSSLGGSARVNIGRIGADGAIDAAFNPGANGTVNCLAVQPDRRIVVGGQFTTLGGVARSYLGRLEFDGTLDAAFSPAVSGQIYALALQPDGKLVVGGAFTNLCGQPRSYIGRLNADGTLDVAFNPGANNAVYSLALQPDGGIVVGGAFTNLGGTSRRFIGRLDGTGTLDLFFNPGANTDVHALVLQPDGKLLVAGRFTALAGRSCSYISRLNLDGSADTAFSGAASGVIYSLCLQADGRILAGGSFNQLGGQLRQSLGRLNRDGSPDTTFNPGAGGTVYALALQGDGRILAGGTFINLGNQTRRGLGRLTNSYPAIRELVVEKNAISWLLSGASPELRGPTVELSTNGTEWSSVGPAVRTDFGWLFDGFTPPLNATVRARGFAAGGYQDGSGWLVEQSKGPPAISQPPSDRTNNAGTTAWFAVLPAGDPPFTYQWYRDGAPLQNGGNRFGAQTAVLRLNTVLGQDAGLYHVVVSNALGNVSSVPARLVVIDPFISSQPANRTVNASSNVTFSVQSVGGPPLSFEWHKDGVRLNDGGKVSGARTPTLTLLSVFGAEAGGYSVLVSNTAGMTTSRVATLKVVDPFIVAQPASQFVNPGETATFNVAVLATSPLHYQWRKNGNDLPGATLPSLVLTNSQQADIASYDLVLTNAFGVVTSAVALLVVNRATVDAFNPGTDGYTSRLAIQPDGKILVRGSFSNIGGEPVTNLARLNTDGSLDDTFSPPSVVGNVYSVALQNDGKILIGGGCWTEGPVSRTNLIRLNRDGSIDTNFNAGGTHWKGTTAVQPDGRIVAGGGYGIERFQTDGTPDPTFTKRALRTDYLAIQADGKILIADRWSYYLRRLNADGSDDVSFSVRSMDVLSIALQPNRKILLGGNFTLQGRKNIARLNEDGALDTNFMASVNEVVSSLALQADGRIVMGGNFTNISGQLRNRLARLEPDGRLDGSFNPDANAYVADLAIQEDGAIVVAGSFDTIGRKSRGALARLSNTDPASQTLTWMGTSLSWMRGGCSPEFWTAIFESSTNNVDWERFGHAIPVAGGWELTDTTLPDSASVRVRGLVSGGASAGSVWFVEKILPPRPQILKDGNAGFVLGQFGFNIRALSSQTVIVEGSTNLLDWVPVATNVIDALPTFFTDPESESLGMRFYRLRLQEN